MPLTRSGPGLLSVLAAVTGSGTGSEAGVSRLRRTVRVRTTADPPTPAASTIRPNSTNGLGPSSASPAARGVAVARSPDPGVGVGSSGNESHSALGSFSCASAAAGRHAAASRTAQSMASARITER